jgi:Rieske Fe-S protein
MQAISIDQLVGQILGSYRVERFLGKGRFNVVYLGRNLASQRLDALTIYLVPSHFSPEASARFLKRFHKESAAITKLDHPHILPIYEYGEYVGAPYLVTPYVTQGSLADLLKRYGRYDHTAIVPVLEQLASGIGYAHSRGHIHGALGPSNVVVRDDDTLQVAGFGLMHMLQLGGIEKSGQPYAHLLTVGQTLLASPEYIAPEVVQGQVIDVRSDIYALGCILFELLCGRPPFTGSDPLEIVKQHVIQDIPSIRTFHSGVPIALVSVVNQALERDPARRFQYVEELKEAFVQASRGASLKSTQKGLYLEEEPLWPEQTRISEQLQEMRLGGYGGSDANKWQLLPPIITGKLPAMGAAQGATPTVGQWLPQDQPAAVTLPPLVPSLPPVSTVAGNQIVVPDTDHAIPTPLQSALAREEMTQSGKNKAVPAKSDPALNSVPGVYEDKNKLAQSYSWWSQDGAEEEDQEEGRRDADGGKPRPRPYDAKQSEENPHNAQTVKITPLREPLLVPQSDNWMSEPVAPVDLRRDFKASGKKSGRKSRRRVVAFLAAGGVAAAGAAVTLNLDHLMALANQFSTTYIQTSKTKPLAQGNGQPTQPPQTQPTQPPQTQPPAHTGTVIGNTKQNANSAVDFVNPADTTASLLVRLTSGAFVAYKRACTHVGVLVNYDPATKKLVCPAHGAVFDPANGGAVVQGPAQLPLPKVGIQVQADGTVTTV